MEPLETRNTAPEGSSGPLRSRRRSSVSSARILEARQLAAKGLRTYPERGNCGLLVLYHKNLGFLPGPPDVDVQRGIHYPEKAP